MLERVVFSEARGYYCSAVYLFVVAFCFSISYQFSPDDTRWFFVKSFLTFPWGIFAFLLPFVTVHSDTNGQNLGHLITIIGTIVNSLLIFRLTRPKTEKQNPLSLRS